MINKLFKDKCKEIGIEILSRETPTLVLEADVTEQSIMDVINDSNPKERFNSAFKYLIKDMLKIAKEKTNKPPKFESLKTVKNNNIITYKFTLWA